MSRSDQQFINGWREADRRIRNILGTCTYCDRPRYRGLLVCELHHRRRNKYANDYAAQFHSGRCKICSREMPRGQRRICDRPECWRVSERKRMAAVFASRARWDGVRTVLRNERGEETPIIHLFTAKEEFGLSMCEESSVPIVDGVYQNLDATDWREEWYEAGAAERSWTMWERRRDE